jgi:hypothetical protein
MEIRVGEYAAIMGIDEYCDMKGHEAILEETSQDDSHMTTLAAAGLFGKVSGVLGVENICRCFVSKLDERFALVRLVNPRTFKVFGDLRKAPIEALYYEQ